MPLRKIRYKRRWGVRRDYHQKDYGNPLFPKKIKTRKAVRLSLRNKIALFVFLLSIGAWVYFLFFSPYFEITDLEIQKISASGRGYNLFVDKENLKRALEGQLNQSRFLFFNQSNIFIFDTDELFQTINDKFLLESISVKKIYPAKVKITFQEKMGRALLASGNSYYYLDADGKVIDKGSGEKYVMTDKHKDEKDQETENLNEKSTPSPFEFALLKLKEAAGKNELPLIWDISEQERKSKEGAISEQTMRQVIDIWNDLPQKTPLSVILFKLSSKTNNRIDVLTNKGYWLYLNAENEIKKSLNTLITALNQEIGDRQDLEYIDLRFEDRVYYK